MNSTKLSMSATASPKSLVPSVSSTSTLSLSSGKSGSSSVRSSVRNVYEQVNAKKKKPKLETAFNEKSMK